MTDRSQIIWHRAQRLSFVWKRHFIEEGQKVSPQRRQNWVKMFVELFERHGLPEESEK